MKGEEALKHLNLALSLKEFFYFFSSDERFNSLQIDPSFSYKLMIKCLELTYQEI